MKNIHLIPTDKPSRLYSKDGKHILDTNMVIDWYISSAGYKAQNIYITNDEEIKEGDWVLGDFPDKPICKVISKYGEEFTAQSLNGNKHGLSQSDSKKIILATDGDLIKAGVQAIDNEFLEWFVKNPSCEEVKVESWQPYAGFYSDYKIIIPKEEPLSYEEFRKLASNNLNNKFDTDCSKYSEDGDSDNYFYTNCKYWEAKIKEEQQPHNFLPGFVKQFDPKNGEIDGEEWSAIQLLRWLELNKFKIVK